MVMTLHDLFVQIPGSPAPGSPAPGSPARQPRWGGKGAARLGCGSQFFYRPQRPTTKPMIRPPTMPVPSIGAQALVIMASGRLSKRPKSRPRAQPGSFNSVAPITNPIANRLINAPVMAAVLSENERGIISSTSMPPKISPQIVPRRSLDKRDLLYFRPRIYADERVRDELSADCADSVARFSLQAKELLWKPHPNSAKGVEEGSQV